jgi:acyl-CoA thioester hydrolase
MTRPAKVAAAGAQALTMNDTMDGRPSESAGRAGSGPRAIRAQRLDAAAGRAGAEPQAPTAPGFQWQVRVYYEDTDAGGVVYYANYLRFFERCRTEWLRSLGYGQRELVQRDGVLFVVAGTEMRYLRPAYLDDAIRVEARIAGRFASYVVFEQHAWRGPELLSHGRVKVACVDAATMKPRRLPAELAAALDRAHGAAGDSRSP